MPIILVIVACLLALNLAYLVRSDERALRERRMEMGRTGERRVGELLDSAGGVDRLDDVVFGRTARETAQIDHLVRGPCCLLVVETKRWSGRVSGGIDDRHWILTRRDGSVTSMRNPLAQARRQARAALSSSCEDIDVDSLVVMVGNTVHESGAFPPGVVFARDLVHVLPALLARGGREDPVQAARVARAWDRLVEEAFSPGAERRANRYVAMLEDRFGTKPWRAWIVAALCIALVAWAMGMRIDLLTPVLSNVPPLP